MAKPGGFGGLHVAGAIDVEYPRQDDAMHRRAAVDQPLEIVAQAAEVRGRLNVRLRGKPVEAGGDMPAANSAQPPDAPALVDVGPQRAVVVDMSREAEHERAPRQTAGR